ncbi:MAG: hypothetical protein ABI439_13750 [Rhodospirillales bacterium]
MLLGGATIATPDLVVTPRRRKMVEALRDRFAAQFPAINYELAWQVGVVNAQARHRGRHKVVMLYGGLLICPSMAVEGLALAFAHETGHLLGGHPKAYYMPSLSCECSADHWAGRVAIPGLFGRGGGAKILHRGINQLAAMFNVLAQSDTALPASDALIEFKRRHMGAGFEGRRKPPCYCAAP